MKITYKLKMGKENVKLNVRNTKTPEIDHLHPH